MGQLADVVVTGVGPVSAVGCTRNDFWDALVHGRHGFGSITLCDPGASPSRIAAEVKDFRLGVYVGTSIGNLGDVLTLNEHYRSTGQLPPQTAFHAFNHSAACILSAFFNIRGPIHTTTSGCNSGLDALGQAMRMIQADAVDAMLVVGSDCELVPEILAALNASGSLATRYNDAPGRASRPFDRGRDGNVIGEGAGALLLESGAHARARQARAMSPVIPTRPVSMG